MDGVTEIKQVLEDLLEDNKFLELLQEQKWEQIKQYKTMKDYESGHPFSGVDLYAALINLCWNTGVPTDKNPDLKDNILSDDIFPYNIIAFDVIKIPNFITQIGYSAFEDTSFEQIILNTNITDIDDSAFQSCWNLKDIVLPASLERLGSDVFYGCHSLVFVSIFPKSLKSVGDTIFTECDKLKQIIFKGTKEQAGDLGLLNATHLGIYHKVTVKCNDGDVVIGDE